MKRPDPKNYKPTDFIRGVYENDLEKYIDYLEQNQAQLQQGGVVRPEVESAKEGELLPAEAVGKSVSAGPCCCNNTTLGQTECDGLCVDIDEYD